MLVWWHGTHFMTYRYHLCAFGGLRLTLGSSYLTKSVPYHIYFHNITYAFLVDNLSPKIAILKSQSKKMLPTWFSVGPLNRIPWIPMSWLILTNYNNALVYELCMENIMCLKLTMSWVVNRTHAYMVDVLAYPTKTWQRHHTILVLASHIRECEPPKSLLTSSKWPYHVHNV